MGHEETVHYGKNIGLMKPVHHPMEPFRLLAGQRFHRRLVAVTGILVQPFALFILSFQHRLLRLYAGKRNHAVGSQCRQMDFGKRPPEGTVHFIPIHFRNIADIEDQRHSHAEILAHADEAGLFMQLFIGDP